VWFTYRFVVLKYPQILLHIPLLCQAILCRAALAFVIGPVVGIIKVSSLLITKLWYCTVPCHWWNLVAITVPVSLYKKGKKIPSFVQYNIPSFSTKLYNNLRHWIACFENLSTLSFCNETLPFKHFRSTRAAIAAPCSSYQAVSPSVWYSGYYQTTYPGKHLIYSCIIIIQYSQPNYSTYHASSNSCVIFRLFSDALPNVWSFQEKNYDVMLSW
jgi:hypothetical protein